MKIEHLPLLNSVSAPTIHPDGSRTVVAVTRPDFGGDSYVGQLWEVPLDGRPARRMTRGFRDTSPRFSPDGQVLAFLRTEAEGRPQLHIVEAAGGEPQAVTDQKLGVSDFDWSPDSRQFAFTSRVPEEGRYGTTDGVGAGAEDARLITDYKFRMNGLGYTGDKRQQIFLVDVPSLGAEPAVAPAGRAKKAAAGAQRNGAAVRSHASGSGAVAGSDAVGSGGAAGDAPGFSAVPAARQLTYGDADHASPRFTADGGRILFSASLHPGADADLVTDIYSVGTDGGEPSRLTNLGGRSALDASAGTVSADGKWLFFLASDMGPGRRDFVGSNTGVYAAPLSDLSRVQRLTDSKTLDFSENGDRLVAYGPDAVLALERSRGSQRLLKVSAGGPVSILSEGPRLVTGAAAAGDAVVVSFTDPRTAGEVAVLDDGRLRPLTDFSAALRATTGVTEPREATFEAPDGYPVHGWLLLPEGNGPHPVLLNIHGGPFAQYGWGLFDEAQVYAEAGYAVLMCNPRGAAGYGFEHGRAIKEAMGTVDLADVLAFLDGALASHPELDQERLGIMGGSYGGYLTAWTISQDHRFTAAIVERGYLDPASFVGSSDIGWFFSAEYTGTEPDAVQAQSPMAQVQQVRTPTMVIHSEEDLRCPLEQAQRYYTALKQQDVDTQLLVFPGENHELSRSGTPHHRKQRFEHILAWWARYLPTSVNPAPEQQQAE